MHGKQTCVFMWEDLVNPALPLHVHLVLPEPPFTLMPGTIGTLLLVQNPTLFRAACLTTVIEPALPRLRVTEVAHSFDLIFAISSYSSSCWSC